MDSRVSGGVFGGSAAANAIRERSVTFLPGDREVRLRCYRNALRNWKVDGYVNFKAIQQWLVRELVDYPLREIRRELHDYVDQGGAIDEQRERRPEYVDYEFHYDLRVKIGARRVYFETVLMCDDADDPNDPKILVVSLHDV
jgi:hypothetical protein